MYNSVITYPIYDLNSTLFIEVLREVLQAEFLEQRNTHGKLFLPQIVKGDDYLINPISDNEINPAFCAITRANADVNSQFFEQGNLDNTFIIQVVASGLENLRKITDAIYIILNDMNVKNYFFQYKNSYGETLISDSGSYSLKSITTDLETKKTMNDKDIITGNLVLNVEIAEIVKYNETTPIETVNTTLGLGEWKTEIIQETNF